MIWNILKTFIVLLLAVLCAIIIYFLFFFELSRFIAHIKLYDEFVGAITRFLKLTAREKFDFLKKRYLYSNDEEKEEFIELVIFVGIIGVLASILMFVILP